MATMSWNTLPPQDILLQVDKWARNTFQNPAPTTTGHHFGDKKDLSKILKEEVRNADQLIKITSEFHHILQISRIAMVKYNDKLAAVNLELQTNYEKGSH